MPRQIVAVEKEVIKWARESIGLSEHAAAQALKVTAETLRAWEAGEDAPGIGQLRRMAMVYKRPVTALMQPDIPPGAPVPKDFRTVGGIAPKLSVDAYLAIREAQRIQMVITDLVEDVPEIMPPVHLSFYSSEDSAAQSGLLSRNEFGAKSDDYKTQIGFRGINQAYNAWRTRLQLAGILVLAKPMHPMDCRGFSLHEGEYPVIVVNSREIDQAKIFTLIHEYAHLTRHQGGICQERDAEANEKWCNQFAASFLVPEDWLRWNVPAHVTSTAEVARLAKRFKVSRHVIALRLKELELGDANLYAMIKQEDDAHAFVPPTDTGDEEKEEERGGPNQAQRRLTEVGVGYAGAILAALDRGVIDLREAGEYLDIGPASFEPLTQRVKETRERYG